MLSWPSTPSLFQETTPGCHYQLTYCYELLACAEETLYLVNSTVTDPKVGPGSPADSLMGAGTCGFFWPETWNPDVLIEGSVATFRLGDTPLLEWRVVEE
jgi:hypothetical protein